MTSPDTPWLARGSHSLPEDCADTERCLFEWYNWLTRRRHTYRRPPGVSAVLWRYGMGLNDLLPGARRQELVRFLPDGEDRLAGTEHDGRDETRGYIALDWLARAGLPAWIALAGLDEEAAALRDLPRVVGPGAVLVAAIVVRTAGSRAADTAADRSSIWSSMGSSWDGVRDMVRRSALNTAWNASGAAGASGGVATVRDTAYAAVESARAACLAASRAGDEATWGKRKDVIAGLQSSAIALYDVLIAGEWPPPS